MINDFVFDGQELSGFGYIICNFNSSSELETSTVSDMSFTDIKSPLSNISHAVATSYTDNLTKTVQIMKNPCDNENLDITNDDMSELSRWLCRKEYKMFKWVDDEDDDEIFYEVRINLRQIRLGNGRVGVELDIISNRPFGFTREFTINKSIGGSFFSSQEEYDAYTGDSYPPMVESFFPTVNSHKNQYYGIGNYVRAGVYRSTYTSLSSDTEVVIYMDTDNLFRILSLSEIEKNEYSYYYDTSRGTKGNTTSSIRTEPLRKYSYVMEANYADTSLFDMYYAYIYDLVYKTMKVFDSFESAENYFATGSLSGLVSKPDSTDTGFSVNVFSDDEGYIYPDMIITIKADGDLKITNEFENRSTYIADCKSGEIITIIGGDTLQITSSDELHDLSKCFNYKFLRLCTKYRNYTNIISVELACDIEMKYKGIRKVGL